MADTKVKDESAIIDANVGTSELYANDVTGGNIDTKVTGNQLGENALTKTTTGLNTTADDTKGAINELKTANDAVTPTKGVIDPENTTIDCSVGQIIQMAITSDKTGGNALSFSNLPGGAGRTIVITGDYVVEFNSNYDTHFQSTLTKRKGNVQLFTVINYGTTGDPLYAIKDTLGGVEVLTIPITAYGAVASIGTKIRFPMMFPFYILSLEAYVSVAPTGAGLTINVLKDTTSILTNKLTIDATEKDSTTASTAYTFVDDPARTFAKRNIVQVDIDTVGSTLPGEGVVLVILGYRLGPQ